jgi:ankyrin repeat protein
MKKLYTTLFLSLSFTTIAYAMEQQEQELTSIEIHEKKVSALLQQIPEDIGVHIVCLQLQDIHNQVNTPEEARDFLVSVSLVNKFCNQFANRPLLIKNIISNLSATLREDNYYILYEETMAETLKTPATKKYLEINNAIFSEHLKKDNILSLLQQGADPCYRRSIRNKNPHDPEKYDRSRHHYTGMPLIFYASGPTENDLAIARCLLEHGADVNKKIHDGYGYYPLEIAIQRDLSPMVALLLSYKPIYKHASLALEKNNSEILELLYKQPNVDYTDALKIAIEKKNYQKVQELFDHGATSDSQLQYVVTQTLTNPAWPGMHGTLPSTEILQLFIKKGIQNQSLHTQVLIQAQATKQKAKEVIALLSSKTEQDLQQ